MTHKLVSALKGVKQTATGWTACCPAHDDRNASLSINRGDDGRLLVKCHVGCATEDVVLAVGMTLADLFEPRGKESKSKSRIVGEYIYRGADGSPYAKAIRLEPKSFRQQHWTGTDWAWGKPKGPKVPYRLPELLAAPTAPVFITEGEKHADALAEHGLTATSASEGAGKWTRDLNQHFAGREVFILADNDKPGRDHARLVANNLLGTAREIRVVYLPGLPDKGDVIDWLKAGGQASDLEALCRSAPVWAALEPGAGARLLDDVHGFIGRFVAYPSEAARIAHALWIAHTHAMEKFHTTARLAFMSAEKESGKVAARDHERHRAQDALRSRALHQGGDARDVGAIGTGFRPSFGDEGRTLTGKP
jgi:hypothetical protein